MFVRLYGREFIQEKNLWDEFVAYSEGKEKEKQATVAANTEMSLKKGSDGNV